MRDRRNARSAQKGLHVKVGCLRKIGVGEFREFSVMSFGEVQKAPWATEIKHASESESVVCVAAICAIAALPLLLSIALIIWGT
jgi:hypothetical protein